MEESLDCPSKFFKMQLKLERQCCFCCKANLVRFVDDWYARPAIHPPLGRELLKCPLNHWQCLNQRPGCEPAACLPPMLQPAGAATCRTV